MTAFCPAFSRGDERVICAGKPVLLRLSFGALFEITQRLNAPTPSALSEKIRSGDFEVYRVIFLALMIPNGAENLQPSSSEVEAALPQICSIFETSFSEQNDE